MDQELLKQAQRRLRIRDVYQVEAHAKAAPGYDPGQGSGDENPAFQTKHLVRQSIVLEPVGDEASPDLFRVYIELGVRWKSNGDASNEEDDLGNEESWSEIGATYVAEYEIHQDLEPDALTMFALHNASYHVWPYFREFVASQCQRMNFPKLVMPMMRLAANRKGESVATAPSPEHD